MFLPHQLYSVFTTSYIVFSNPAAMKCRYPICSIMLRDLTTKECFVPHQLHSVLYPISYIMFCYYSAIKCFYIISSIVFCSPSAKYPFLTNQLHSDSYPISYIVFPPHHLYSVFNTNSFIVFLPSVLYCFFTQLMFSPYQEVQGVFTKAAT